METKISSTSDEKTRLRVLQAAGEVFAEEGFKSATVREICRRAGANVAAVNYHFGDKGRLYGRVCREGFQAALSRYPANMGITDDASAEQRLRAFIRSFLYRMLDETDPMLHRMHRLAAREMTEPTGVLDDIVQNMIKPLFGRLWQIVTEILGPEVDDRTAVLCARSVVGQCLFYRHSQPVLMRLDPNQQFTPEALDELAAHISRFSLAAMNQVRKELAAAARKGKRP
jgi:AcrR family transcriptional regulator